MASTGNSANDIIESVLVDVDGYGKIIRRSATGIGTHYVQSRFEPQIKGAAPITHIGGDSFCVKHKPECQFASDSIAYAALLSPSHSCRCFCPCMSQFAMDKAYALEIQERDLTVDAFENLLSMAQTHEPHKIFSDPDLKEIVYRYEQVYRLYQSLSEIDSEGSACYLKNLLATRVCTQDDIESLTNKKIPEASPFFLPSLYLSLSNTLQNNDESVKQQEKNYCNQNQTSNPLERDEDDMCGSTQHTAVTNFTSHYDEDTALDTTTVPNSEQTLSQGLRSANNSRHRKYLKNAALKSLKKNSASRYNNQDSSSTPAAVTLTSLNLIDDSNFKWKNLCDDGTDIKVWYKMIPQSTALLFRLDGRVPTSLMNVISVMAQVEYTRKWVPSISFPFRMGLVYANCVERNGRFDMLSYYDFAMPWPFKNRTCCVHGWVVDDLERNNTLTFIYKTVNYWGSDYSATSSSNSIRTQFDGGATITPIDGGRSCYVRMLSLIDPKESINATIINFFAGRFMKMAFGAFRKQCLEVARNPKSEFALAQHRDKWLYGFLQERLNEINKFRNEVRNEGLPMHV